MKITTTFLVFLVLAVQALTAANNDWHVIKSKEIGAIPPSAVLKTIKLNTPQADGTVAEARLDVLVFPEKNFSLNVLDHPLRDQSLQEVMQGSHYVAGINGGYFQPNGTPLGLLMHRGTMIHPQERARLLSGFFVATDHKMALLRVAEPLPSGTTEILQAGPFLLDHGLPVVGLEGTRSARRTFLASDNHGLWAMGVISPTTLAEAARVLQAASTQIFPTSKIQRALNLDGGSSSALWVAIQPEPFSQQEFGRVRNFLGLKAHE